MHKMPVVNPPESLLKLSIEAACRKMPSVVANVACTAESAANVEHQFEKEMHKIMSKKRTEKSTTGLAQELKNMKKVVKKHDNVLNKLIRHLPATIVNEIFNKVLATLAHCVKYDDKEIKCFIEEDECSFASMLNMSLHLILKTLLTHKVSSLNINPVSDTFSRVLANYLIKYGTYKDDAFIKKMDEKKKDFFVSIFTTSIRRMVSLTSLSLQNLAHGDLLWLICCHCPNLWHLDISGELFNLQRYCVTRVSADEYVTAVDKNGRRNYAEADFVNALCGLYGYCNLPHKKYDGFAKGCRELKTLLLPDVKWEKNEEHKMLQELLIIFQHCINLEEVTGVCLLYILCKLNEMDTPPVLLKLKKFNGKTGGHSLIGIDPKRLKKIKLPLVTEVNFTLNIFMPPVTLEIFPNMRHLIVTPYDYYSYTSDDILPYLKNLHTLDMEVTHEISISDMCRIAKNCQLLESLTLTCPALRTKALALSDDHIAKEQLERLSSPPAVRMDVKSKKEYEPCASLSVLSSFSEYAKTLLKIEPAEYEKDNSQVPSFSKLHTLQFFAVRSVDAAALYKCIKGSPKVCTFTFVALKKCDDYNMELDDDFIGRIAPLLKRLREITFSAEDDIRCSVSIEKLTGMAIEHIVKFCKDIRSIGTVANWNVTLDKVKAFNHYFMKNNYILRLH